MVADLNEVKPIHIGPDFQALLPPFDSKEEEKPALLPMERVTRVSSTCSDETQDSPFPQSPLLLWDPTKNDHETRDQYHKLIHQAMLNHVDNQRSRFPDLEILITTMKGLSGRLQDLAEKLLPMVRNDMSKVALAFKYDKEFAEDVMKYLYEEVEVAQIDSDRE